MAKVIHVHLLHNIDESRQKDWYFSSISAVYTVLTAEQVGATKNYLLHAGLSGNGTVCTKKAIIKQSTLISGGRKGDDQNDIIAPVEWLSGVIPLNADEGVKCPLFLCSFLFRDSIRDSVQGQCFYKFRDRFRDRKQLFLTHGPKQKRFTICK